MYLKGRLRKLWLVMRSSLWFVPTLMVSGALGLAVGMVEIDTRVRPELLIAFPAVFGAGAEGSRAMLAAIGTSMITVAGLTFSLTIAALGQAASQYTSRILRNFMQDRANQLVLGFFVGLFVYCLIVLRTIRGGEGTEFVPAIAVTGGLVLAIVGIGVLIFFIHHIAASIQASTVIASAAAETVDAIQHLFPQALGEGADDEAATALDAALSPSSWHPVLANKAGYIQDIDPDDLLKFAAEHEVVVRMERGIGEFVAENSLLASVTAGGRPGERMRTELNRCYAVTTFRTIGQDANFGIRQLVDIALKALSPGINDTTTAVMCVDYLGEVLGHLARRRIETRYRMQGGQVRVIARGPTFASLVTTAFDQIRDAAEGNTAVIVQLLRVLEQAAHQTDARDRREILLKQVNLIAEMADGSVKTVYNRRQVAEQLEAALAALDDEPGEHVLSLRTGRAG